MANRLAVGESVQKRFIDVVTGPPVAIPAPGGRTHLQFRRFAGCPICHLHLRNFANRHHELAAAGLTEVAFFHSPDSELRGYQSLLPFAVVADPERIYYREFGVEVGPRSVAHPRALWSAMRGYAKIAANRRDPANVGVGMGDGSTHLGLPADFLIHPDGTLAAVKYGRHADAQWSVDQLLEIIRSLPRRP